MAEDSPSEMAFLTPSKRVLSVFIHFLNLVKVSMASFAACCVHDFLLISLAGLHIVSHDGIPIMSC